MEIDSQKQAKLKGQLSSLPAKAAIALLREVQRDELRGDDTYPHKFVTRQLIAHLAGQGFEAEFLGQPWQLFCEPFDAFLVDEKADIKQRGAILRKSVTAIWNWLMAELFQNQLPDLEIEIIQALMEDKPGQAKALMAEFHKQAGDAIWAELSDVEEGSRVHLSYNVKFGKPGVFEDALEVARVLRIAPALIQLRSQIQVGLTFDHDEDVHHCHGLYKQFLQSADDHIELGMLLIANRLEKPYEIVRLLQHHTGAELDSVMLRDPAAQSATLVLSDLESSINEAIKLISQYDDFPLVARKITEFHDCIELFTSLIEISPRSVWGNRIIQIRNDLSSAIKTQVEQLPRLINMLRYKNNAQQTFRHKEAEEGAPNAYDVKQAVYIASLLQLSGRLLKQLSINDAIAKARNESNNFIETAAEIIVSELAKGEWQEKKLVLKYFKPVVELTLILQGEELASILERRGESAFRAKPAVKVTSS